MFSLEACYPSVYQLSNIQACVMLSLETDYPPAYQLALDMLKVSLCSEFQPTSFLFGILVTRVVLNASLVPRDQDQIQDDHSMC